MLTVAQTETFVSIVANEDVEKVNTVYFYPDHDIKFFEKYAKLQMQPYITTTFSQLLFCTLKTRPPYVCLYVLGRKIALDLCFHLGVY